MQALLRLVQVLSVERCVVRLQQRGVRHRRKGVSDLDGHRMRGGVDRGGVAVHDGVEAVLGIGRVLDGSRRAVRLHQRVAPLDDVAVPRLVLGLGVAGVRVADAVAERVVGDGVRVDRGGRGVLGVGKRRGRETFGVDERNRAEGPVDETAGAHGQGAQQHGHLHRQRRFN